MGMDCLPFHYAWNSGETSLFECSFLQNSIETMMLFYEMEEDEILAFYEEAYGILRQKGFGLVYLDTEGLPSYDSLRLMPLTEDLCPAGAAA